MGFRMIHERSISDQTEVYKVKFTGQTTVREFIEKILKKNEWGCVSIDGTKSSMWYQGTEIESSTNMEEVMDRVIQTGSANGGWTRMDYRLLLTETIKVDTATENKKKDEGKNMAKMTKKALLEALAERNIKAELHVEQKETKPVRNPGAVGISETKKGNLMVYMVNEAGKLYNTSVHTDRRVANARVLERLVAANA